jgi:hypothetical protein
MLLVLVAHPDDCVVLAGEYALWVLGHGMSVENCLLHFRDRDDPASPRAKDARGRGVGGVALGRSAWEQICTFSGIRPVPDERNLRRSVQVRPGRKPLRK